MGKYTSPMDGMGNEPQPNLTHHASVWMTFVYILYWGHHRFCTHFHWTMISVTNTSKSTNKNCHEYASKKGRNPGNHQLRLVGYPIIYSLFYTSQVMLSRISELSTVSARPTFHSQVPFKNREIIPIFPYGSDEIESCQPLNVLATHVVPCPKIHRLSSKNTNSTVKFRIGILSS